LLLILAAPALALTMNFLRSLVLTLLTTTGRHHRDWHDPRVRHLGVTAALLAASQSCWNPKRTVARSARDRPVEPVAPRLAPYRLFWTGSVLTLALARSSS